MNKLWIFTLNWNGAEKLKKLAPTLLSSLKDVPYCWMIKDNASKDNSIEYLNSLSNSNIQIIAYKNNLQNFSTGMNYLYHQAVPEDDDYILLLNNDVIFNDTDSIKKMIDLLENDNDIGVVGAKLTYTGTNKLQHAGVVFSNIHQLPLHFRLNEIVDKISEKDRLFQVVTGAVLLTKSKYFKQCYQNDSGICGMDERFIWAFDDVDLCLSIKYNMNKKIVYCGSTNIFHEESASLKKNPVNKLFMAHNTNLLKNKWGHKFKLDQNLYITNKDYNLYKK